MDSGLNSSSSHRFSSTNTQADALPVRSLITTFLPFSHRKDGTMYIKNISTVALLLLSCTHAFSCRQSPPVQESKKGASTEPVCVQACKHIAACKDPKAVDAPYSNEQLMHDAMNDTMYAQSVMYECLEDCRSGKLQDDAASCWLRTSCNDILTPDGHLPFTSKVICPEIARKNLSEETAKREAQEATTAAWFASLNEQRIASAALLGSIQDNKIPFINGYAELIRQLFGNTSDEPNAKASDFELLQIAVGLNTRINDSQPYSDGPEMPVSKRFPVNLSWVPSASRGLDVEIGRCDARFSPDGDEFTRADNVKCRNDVKAKKLPSLDARAAPLVESIRTAYRNLSLLNLTVTWDQGSDGNYYKAAENAFSGSIVVHGKDVWSYAKSVCTFPCSGTDCEGYLVGDSKTWAWGQNKPIRSYNGPWIIPSPSLFGWPWSKGTDRFSFKWVVNEEAARRMLKTNNGSPPLLLQLGVSIIDVKSVQSCGDEEAIILSPIAYRFCGPGGNGNTETLRIPPGCSPWEGVPSNPGSSPK